MAMLKEIMEALVPARLGTSMGKRRLCSEHSGGLNEHCASQERIDDPDMHQQRSGPSLLGLVLGARTR